MPFYPHKQISPSFSGRDATRLGLRSAGIKVSKKGINTLTWGGDGSDASVNVLSGTTTVDLGSAEIKVLQYRQVLVASGATLAFSNPHADGTIIIIKVLGRF